MRCPRRHTSMEREIVDGATEYVASMSRRNCMESRSAHLQFVLKAIVSRTGKV